MLILYGTLMCHTVAQSNKCYWFRSISWCNLSRLSKVFHRIAIPHGKLLSKITSKDIEGSILRWVQDFLSNRRQWVHIRGSYSDWTSTTSFFLKVVSEDTYFHDVCKIHENLKIFVLESNYVALQYSYT